MLGCAAVAVRWFFAGATAHADDGFDGQGKGMQFLALEQFAALLNQTFTVAMDSDGEASFVLVEARPLPPAAGAGAAVRTSFSLLFRNEAAVLLPQKIYAMTHAALGQFGIFLVPIARDRDGFLYQAVFN